MQCQALLEKAENIEEPQPEHLLEELIVITKNIKSISSDLASDASSCLNDVKEKQETVQIEAIDIDLIARDPGERRPILNDNDRLYMLKQGPFQPILSRYPKNNDIDPSKQCRFRAEWFKEYPHLEYSVSKEAAFCYVCLMFPDGVGHEKADEAWTKKGVKAWHKMKSRGKSKPGKLATHFSCNSHKAALEALVAFQHRTNHIDVMVEKERLKLLVEEEAEALCNREAVKILLDVARTLARQGLAFRGHGSEIDGNGNFHQVVLLVARHSPVLRKWLEDAKKRPHRVTYMNWRSQNEYLMLLSDYVSEKVAKDIKKSEIFSIMADTTPDTSHLDQLSVIARYVNEEGIPNERLVDIRDIDDKTGDGQAKAILTSLESQGIDSDRIVFQSYDYTSSMSGKFKGCQAKMKEYLHRDVPYFPCLAHRINTTVEHSCSASNSISNMFDILEQLYVFFTSSTKRYFVFQQHVKDIDGALELRNLSVTRWTARSESIRAVWTSFDGILAALENQTRVDDRKTKATARNILGKAKSFEFVVCVMFMKNIMSKTQILTQQVQSVDLNIIDSLEALSATITTLKYVRQDHGNIDKQIEAAVSFCTQLKIDAEAEFSRHHRPRAIPLRFDERPENATHLDLTRHYRKEFLQVLDVQIAALEDNLKVAFEIIMPAARLLMPPYSAEIEESELIISLVSLFPDNCKPDEDSLLTELNIFRQHCKDNKPNIDSLVTAAEYSKRFQNLFPLTEKCMRLALTAPITAASNERSFSKLKLIKTLMRSTMSQERLKYVIRLASEKDITDNIDLEVLVKRWAKLPKTGRVISIGDKR